MIMKNIYQLIRQFHDDEDGVLSIELVLMVPLVVWALLTTLVYFDVYRAESLSTRAGLTIADMYSREDKPLEEDFIDGSRELLELLTESDTPPSIRVTVFWFDEDNQKLERAWSKISGDYYLETLDNIKLANLTDRIPRMANNDRAILIETQTTYEPPFSFAMGPFTGDSLSGIGFGTFTVIKPRFTNNYCYDPTPSSPNNGDNEC